MTHPLIEKREAEAVVKKRLSDPYDYERESRLPWFIDRVNKPPEIQSSGPVKSHELRCRPNRHCTPEMTADFGFNGVFRYEPSRFARAILEYLDIPYVD